MVVLAAVAVVATVIVVKEVITVAYLVSGMCYVRVKSKLGLSQR